MILAVGLIFVAIAGFVGYREISRRHLDGSSRRVRIWPIAIGSLMLLIGLSACGAAAFHVDLKRLWYRVLPIEVAISQVANPGQTMSPAAWNEIHRRLAGYELSDTQLNRLADACIVHLPTADSVIDPAWVELMRQDATKQMGGFQRMNLIAFSTQQQHVASPCPLRYDIWNWMVRMLETDRLSPMQRRDFVASMVQYDVAVDSPVAQGALLRYTLKSKLAGPSRGMWYNEQAGRVLVDDRAVQFAQSYITPRTSFTTGGKNVRLDVDLAPLNLEPGLHKLTVESHVRVVRGNMTDRIPGMSMRNRTVWDHTETASTAFTVQPRSANSPATTRSVATPATMHAVLNPQ